MGPNLAIRRRLYWIGRSGLRWSSVLHLFLDFISTPFPEILVIHAGGNDLGKIKSVELVRRMKRDLTKLHERFPAMKIVFSCITQRRVWRGANPAKINKARVWVNSVMAAFVRGLGGTSIGHPEIKFDRAGLFRRDGVHLSDVGNDIFLKNLQLGINGLCK